MDTEQSVIIDMVNNKDDRERVTYIFNSMLSSIPENAEMPEIITACYMVFCNIAAFSEFSEDAVKELIDNLATSLKQGAIQYAELKKARNSRVN